MTLAGHIAILRLDHWIKQVFVVPGIVAGYMLFSDAIDDGAALWRIPVALVAMSLVASSNYVVNEILDAPFDRLHPTKHTRPVPSGQVDVPLAWVQWFGLGAAGVATGVPLGWRFVLCAALLWAMGLVYNLAPIRAKDLPFVDAIVESFNNPLRLAAGWFAVLPDAEIPPASLLLGYWAGGAYLMTLKRLAELRAIDDRDQAIAYRPVFAHYTESRLLTAVMTHASAAMLFLGAFTIRYRLELILAFPLVALVMGLYLQLALRPKSPVQEPEHLWRQGRLMGAVAACTIALIVLALVDIPRLADWTEPNAPPARASPFVLVSEVFG